MAAISVARRWLLACTVLLCVAGALPQRAGAQNAGATPTPEQLETFRRLPPDQQRAVLDAMSGPGDGAVRTEPDLQSGPTAMERRARGEDAMGLQGDLGPPRIDDDSTLLLAIEIPESEQGDRAAALRTRRDIILGANPYRLSREGALELPSIPPIALRGLTAEQAAQRLDADPRLAGLTFRVTILPVETAGPDVLEPFGHDLFRDVPTTFAPATDIPVPPEYVLGPGDRVILELIGKRSGRYSLVVDRAGQLNLPDVGPLVVAGLDFERACASIERAIGEQMIGVRANVTMGPLRSVRVFVLGDVVRPGAYTVSGLSTMSHALFTSGGVTRAGSLRNVELKRGGATVGRFDLYDLLLHGDTGNDRRLQSGDVVFVPPVGMTAGVGGHVLRPAIYEMPRDATVADLLHLSGGLTPDGDPRVAKLERIDSTRERIVMDVDLTSAAGRQLKLRAGDVLRVPRVLDDLARTVTLDGHVQRPGRYAWREGMRLTDLLSSLGNLKLNADQRYVMIRREHMPDRRLEVLSADAAAAFAVRGSAADIALQSRDRVTVFDLKGDRRAAVESVIEELRLQTRDSVSPPIVSIGGRVRAPGQYPLEPGMTVSSLVRAGGGLDDAAYQLEAELTRYAVINGEARETQVIPLTLAEILARNPAADVTLQPYDMLVIKQTPEWAEQGAVTIEGEVRFPGKYPIRKGETLSSVVARAGGLTQFAFAEGAVFTREHIRGLEQQQLENLAGRLQSDLSLVALQSVQTTQGEKQSASEALAVGQSLLAQLRNARPTGRLVIDLSDALANKGSDNDVQLHDGDTLVVPPLRQFVSVMGEAQSPTAHVWRSGLGREDYIGLSGGTTEKADRKRIYVVRADGSVVANGGKRWFMASSAEIRPGDTIVIPLDTDRMRPLPLWTAVTTIIYNLSVAVAAIGSL